MNIQNGMIGTTSNGIASYARVRVVFYIRTGEHSKWRWICFVYVCVFERIKSMVEKSAQNRKKLFLWSIKMSLKGAAVFYLHTRRIYVRNESWKWEKKNKCFIFTSTIWIFVPFFACIVYLKLFCHAFIEPFTQRNTQKNYYNQKIMFCIVPNFFRICKNNLRSNILWDTTEAPIPDIAVVWGL